MNSLQRRHSSAFRFATAVAARQVFTWLPWALVAACSGQEQASDSTLGVISSAPTSASSATQLPTGSGAPLVPASTTPTAVASTGAPQASSPNAVPSPAVSSVPLDMSATSATSDPSGTRPDGGSDAEVDSDAGTAPCEPEGDCSPTGDAGAPSVSAAPSVTTVPSVTAAPPSSSSAMPMPDPLAADPTCSSNSYWSGGENVQMRPGEACVECHTRENEGPRYAIAGTVYPTGHEPDDCKGATDADIRVVVTDANGTDHELSVNSSGNFTYNGQLPGPYTAKVISALGERKMFTPQSNGDCNTCHSQDGMDGAPGRIVVPF